MKRAILVLAASSVLAAMCMTAQATTYYADAARPDDAGAGTSWATAKKTIQAAVDLTVDGDTVLVTNGVYSTGGKVTPGSTASTTSRVVIAKAIMVRSMNGPDATIIQGWGPNGQCGPGAVRGVYLTNATLVGFTMTNGFTATDGDYYFDQSGGGVFLAHGGVVSNCVLNGNSAFYGGGTYGGTVNNSTLSGNSATVGGGTSDGTVNNCTISGNHAISGGGTAFGTMTNSIVWGNTGGNFYNGSFAYSSSSPLPPGTANIANDPQFVNPAGGNYHLSFASPCINAGTNMPDMESQTDLDGNPRILGGRVDMGAYEYLALTTSIEPPAVTAPFTVSAGASALFVVTNLSGVTLCGDKPPGTFVATPWLTNGVTQTANGMRWTNQYVALQMSKTGSTNLFQFRCLSNDFLTYSAATTIVCIVNQHILPFVVTNVHLAQRLRSKLMDIRYDVSDPDDTNLMVWITISTNAGATFDIVPANAYDGGAEKCIGQGVTPGTNKWIVWNAGSDWNNQFTTQMAVRVTASDAPVVAGMALIPAGAFQMGTNNLPYEDEMTDAGPNHTVTLSAFYMDKYEVTYMLWTSVYTWATNHGYSFDHAGSGKATNHPVQSVTWYDCVKWCNARSEMEGLTPCYYTDTAQTLVYRGGTVDLQNAWVKWATNGYRLPTEAEWEKAARGGLSGRRFPWYDLNITHTNANYYSTNLYVYDTSATRGCHPSFTNAPMPYTSPAGYFAPNGYGLYDMAGNVFEWCWDWYDGSAYYSVSPASDPHGPSSGTYRVLRSDDWRNFAFFARSAFRYDFRPYYENSNFGFRCVRGLDFSLYPSAMSPPALCETRNPVVTITSAPPALVSYDVTSMTIAGTNGPAVVGGVWWSNVFTGKAGEFTIDNVQFTIDSIALGVGTNIVSVYGTNIVEIQTNASVTIVRGQDDTPPVIAPDALVFPGTNGGVLEAGVATAIVWRVAGIWDNAGGTNLLLPSIAILTTNTGAVVAQPGTNVANIAGLLAWTPWGLESETTAYVVRIEAMDSAGNWTNRIFSRNVFTIVPEPALFGIMALLLWRARRRSTVCKHF